SGDEHKSEAAEGLERLRGADETMVERQNDGAGFVVDATAPPELYTLSLHDALSIYEMVEVSAIAASLITCATTARQRAHCFRWRSEEHTSELQSRSDLVCRLLLEKRKLVLLESQQED